MKNSFPKTAFGGKVDTIHSSGGASTKGKKKKKGHKNDPNYFPATAHGYCKKI